MSNPVEAESAIKDTPGVSGVNTGGGAGVYGLSPIGTGVVGETIAPGGIGVQGIFPPGVPGGGIGVQGTSYGLGVEIPGGTGVQGVGNIGVHGVGDPTVGLFEGIVTVRGNLNVSGDTLLANVTVKGNVAVSGDVLLTNGDCAVDFDVTNADLVEPGAVMVLGDDGMLEPSQIAYDKRAVGVISGAGNYKPGIVLDKQTHQPNRKPIALLGKVYCKVDAQYGAIEMGDLLATSATPGHAMKATDKVRAFGAVIGKALRPLSAGQGLIPMLIALQ